jgi:hypothetical protein
MTPEQMIDQLNALEDALTPEQKLQLFKMLNDYLEQLNSELEALDKATS